MRMRHTSAHTQGGDGGSRGSGRLGRPELTESSTPRIPGAERRGKGGGRQSMRGRGTRQLGEDGAATGRDARRRFGVIWGARKGEEAREVEEVYEREAGAPF